MAYNSDANKARQKESVYRKLYSALLQNNRQVFQGINNKDDSFEDEQRQIQTVFHTELTNLLVGVGATAAVVASLRFGPKYLLSRGFGGGDKKARAMREAETQAKLRGTEDIQRSIGMYDHSSISRLCHYLGNG
jgi:hypothetical protein